MRHAALIRAASLGLLASCGGQPPATQPVPVSAAPEIALPTQLTGDRWFLETTLAGGAAIRLILDSAGGAYLDRSAARRLHLSIVERRAEDGSVEDGVRFPQFADPRIPIPAVDPYPVTDDEEPDDGDGMFGATWFSGRTWTFDYPDRKLILRAPGDLPSVAPEHRIPLGLKRDASGEVITPYGRVQMIVSGETIDMLFDTGATAHVSPDAMALLPGDEYRATNFITKTVFDRWHAAHPAWRVIEKADQIAGSQLPMIEVPSLEIAGYEVGPVWFTWRPDQAFHEYMAEIMDRPSEGAIGGSVLHDFRVSVDWIGATAVFERSP